MITQTPSLKQQLNALFREIIVEHDDKQLEKKIRSLVNSLVSSSGRYTCIHPSYYKQLDISKLRFSYEMHVVTKITLIAESFNQDLHSELLKNVLALAIEYFNLLIVTTKREKIRIHRRMRDLRSKIYAFKLNDARWNASSILMTLHHYVVNTLANSFILAMK